MTAKNRIALVEDAKIQPPTWTGDLADDCMAIWGGALLRAEWMEGQNWWWAITEIGTNLEIDSSNNHEVMVDSGELARRLAEGAACEWLGISAKFANG